MNTFWKRGQRAKIAEKAAIRASHLSEILYRKRGVDKIRAIRLQEVSGIVLNEPIPWSDWLFNERTSHPAFFGKAPQSTSPFFN